MLLRLGFLGISIFGLCNVSLAADDVCGNLVKAFNENVDAGQMDDAQAAVAKLATDPLCSALQTPAQRRLSAVRLRAANKLMARGRPPEEFEALLQAAAKPGVLWQAAATLAEVHFGERRFDQAALGFDAAIEIVRNETLTPIPPETTEIQQLVDRAAQARLLEANLGSDHRAPTYVKTASDQRDGRLGGYLAPSVRGIVPHALPLPIVFDFDRATLTSVGEDAARDLIRAVQEQQPSKIVVVGHTDPRGGVEHNARLSQDRAEAVAKFLHDNGLEVPVEAKGVGATEPMKIEDSEGLTVDDIYALNRRVEWQRE